MTAHNMIKNNGYAILYDLIPREEIRRLNELCDQTVPNRGERKEHGWTGRRIACETPPEQFVHYWSDNLETDQIPLVRQLVEPFVSDVFSGEKYTWLNQDFHVVNPGSNYQLAHVDTPQRHKVFSKITELLGLQIIIALDDFTVQNGATAFLPGSHRQIWECWDKRTWGQYDSLLKDAPRFVAPRGSVLMYHTNTLHSTMPNYSLKPRRALLINVLHSKIVKTVQDIERNL